MVILYVIESKKKKYRYVGITGDLQKRLKQHALSKSAYAPFELIHTEEYDDYSSARKQEKFLKSGKGRDFLDRMG